MAIFKYFTMEAHAQAFMAKGAMLLRQLSYFRAYEDGQVRGDPCDGLLSYEPPAGLEITKQDGTVFKLEDWRFTSSAQQVDILIYCASNQLSAALAERFQSPFCVEIKDPERLIARLKGRAHSSSRLDYEQLISGKVDYRPRQREPGVDWAQPEKLVLTKPEDFSWQDEFRIAVGKRGAFAVENVACMLETGAPAITTPASTEAALIIRVGSLADFTRLHRV